MKAGESAPPFKTVTGYVFSGYVPVRYSCRGLFHGAGRFIAEKGKRSRCVWFRFLRRILAGRKGAERGGHPNYTELREDTKKGLMIFIISPLKFWCG